MRICPEIARSSCQANIARCNKVQLKNACQMANHLHHDHHETNSGKTSNVYIHVTDHENFLPDCHGKDFLNFQPQQEKNAHPSQHTIGLSAPDVNDLLLQCGHDAPNAQTAILPQRSLLIQSFSKRLTPKKFSLLSSGSIS